MAAILTHAKWRGRVADHHFFSFAARDDEHADPPARRECPIAEVAAAAILAVCLARAIARSHRVLADAELPTERMQKAPPPALRRRRGNYGRGEKPQSGIREADPWPLETPWNGPSMAEFHSGACQRIRRVSAGIQGASAVLWPLLPPPPRGRFHSTARGCPLRSGRDRGQVLLMRHCSSSPRRAVRRKDGRARR